MTQKNISHYRIIEKLGAGGMGEVYLAEDTLLNRKVAIKLLPPEATADKRAGKRLVREAQAVAALDHPNICSIYEVAEEDGRSFIVMQYIEGQTLDARVKRAPLALSESLAIAAQIADALAEAHSRGIVQSRHQAGELMLRRDGIAKVLDFGLAKLTERML
ncbi:MAG: serine/threonine-protein kinase [Acidobacteriota bacterium]